MQGLLPYKESRCSAVVWHRPSSSSIELGPGQGEQDFPAPASFSSALHTGPALASELPEMQYLYRSITVSRQSLCAFCLCTVVSWQSRSQ